MKRNISTIYSKALLIIMVLFCFTQCKKGSTTLSVILSDKPLPVIQSYIQGKWKCIYGKGGIAANNIQYYDDYCWTFTKDNRIVQTYKGNIVTDTTIRWVWNRGAYGDSTFIMKFYDKESVPWNYIVDNIHNDTLILRGAYAFDAVHCYLIKL